MVGKKSLAGLAIAVLATTGLGLASWGLHKSSDRGTEVTFTTTSKFQNGAELPAGTYRMRLRKILKHPT
jgi:hypothetical protein